jgi:hypothetical protein
MGDSYFSIGLNYSTINDSLAILYLKKSLQFKPNYKEAEKIIKECHDRLLKSGNKLH